MVMIHAVIRIDDKIYQSGGLIELRAYFPQKISLLIGVHEFCKDGQIDMKEEYRSSLEHELTETLMSEEIEDIIRLQQIIPYCKSSNKAISEAMGICEKLEKNLHVKARYEDEKYQRCAKVPDLAIIDDPIPINEPTKEQVDEAYVSMQKLLKKTPKGM